MSRASRLPLILAATAGGVLVLCAGVAWRTGHAQRAWYILWEGDKKGRAKARNLGNVATVREFVDDLEADVTRLESQVELWRLREFAGVGDHGRPRNAEFERLLAGATSDVDEALKFLDVVKADDVAVRRARKVQIDRAEALGDRIDGVVNARG